MAWMAQIGKPELFIREIRAVLFFSAVEVFDPWNCIPLQAPGAANRLSSSLKCKRL